MHTDPAGLTQRDVDTAWSLIRSTQRDLNFGGLVQPIPMAPFGGYTADGVNPKGQHWEGLIVVHEKYYGQIDQGLRRELIRTLLHEVLHPNRPSMGEEVEIEAWQRAGSLYEKYESMRQKGCGK